MASSDSPPKEDRASMYQLEDDDNSNSDETSTSRTTEDNEDEETVKTATTAASSGTCPQSISIFVNPKVVSLLIKSFNILHFRNETKVILESPGRINPSV